MIWTKGAHQSAKFQTFDCSCKISPNLYFHTLLLLKVYEILAKKVQRSYVSWPWRLMQNLKKNWSAVSKNDKNLVNFDPSTRKSQNLHFHWFLLCKVFNVWPEKVQRSYLSWHWRVIQNLERNQFVVSKLTRGIWQILTWALESLKKFPFNGLLLRKVYIVRAKKVKRSYLSWHWRVMQNLKRNWLAVSKLTWEIWRILTRALENLRNFHFNGLLLSWKSKEELSFMTLKSNAKFQEELTLVSKLTGGIWWILARALESLKNFHFNGLLLSKVYIVWAKNVQRSYLSWRWRVMQNLKKNWLVVWKMTWAIWQIFTRAL